MEIIGIGHRKRVGKDEVGKILYGLIKYSINLEVGSNKIEIVSFADKIKDVAYQLYAVYGLQDKNYYELNATERNIPLPHINKTPRQIWIDLGKAIRDVVHENTWVDCVIQEKRKCDYLLITDVRFPDEAKAIKNKGGILLKVDNPSIPIETDGADEVLASFNGWDHIIMNDGTLEDLNYKVCNVWREMTK